MKKATYANRLANEVREACLRHIRSNKISYQELARILVIPYRGAMTVMQAKEWTLDRAITVAEKLGMDVAVYLDGGVPVGFQSSVSMPEQGATGHNRVTMSQQARKTMQFGLKQGE
jgi:hypothetical protein